MIISTFELKKALFYSGKENFSLTEIFAIIDRTELNHQKKENKYYSENINLKDNNSQLIFSNFSVKKDVSKNNFIEYREKKENERNYRNKRLEECFDNDMDTFLDELKNKINNDKKKK